MTIIVQVLGGLTIAVAVFHGLLWRVFSWKPQLELLTSANRAMVQTMNVMLIYLFLFVGALSVAAPEMLLDERLGRILLAGLAGFWALRAVAQVMAFRSGKALSIVLTAVFVVMTVGYVVVLV